MASIQHIIHQFGFKKFFLFCINGFKLRIYNRFILHSYSQDREDLILDQLIGFKKNGHYVDIGAYDPIWFNNTFRFYKRGWNGVNIEPNPEQIGIFTKQRRRDINLNVGIGIRKGKLPFYKIDPLPLSTFQKDVMKKRLQEGYRLISTQYIKVDRLENVLKQIPYAHGIDFLSIDVEGYEIEVLRSNNWKHYRPRYLCIETVVQNNILGSNKKSSIELFCGSIGYKQVYNNKINIIYKDNNG